jgi:hypothetical protein
VVDVGFVVHVELTDQRRRERVIDILQEGLDDLWRGGGRRLQPSAELGAVAQGGAAAEVLTKNQQHDREIFPPVLGAYDRGADRCPRIDLGQIVERKIHSPADQPGELRQDLVQRLVALMAFRQRRQRRAGDRPVVALDVLQNPFELDIGVPEQSDGFLEVRMFGELARMRPARGQILIDQLERGQLLVEGGGLGERDRELIELIGRERRRRLFGFLGYGSVAFGLVRSDHRLAGGDRGRDLLGFRRRLAGAPRLEEPNARHDDDQNEDDVSQSRYPATARTRPAGLSIAAAVLSTSAARAR